MSFPANKPPPRPPNPPHSPPPPPPPTPRGDLFLHVSENHTSSFCLEEGRLAFESFFSRPSHNNVSSEDLFFAGSCPSTRNAPAALPLCSLPMESLPVPARFSKKIESLVRHFLLMASSGRVLLPYRSVPVEPFSTPPTKTAPLCHPLLFFSGA